MDNLKIEPFHLVGIAVRTTNENGQAGKDIQALWSRFISEGIQKKIPNRVDDSVYCVYTEYEKDYTKPYTTILGCKVSNLNSLPNGMVGKTFTGGKYLKRTAKGNILKGMIIDEWTKIWNSNIPRAYTADFEVYGEKAQNPEKAEVEIFLAIK